MGEELRLEVRIDHSLVEAPEGALVMGALGHGSPDAYDDVERFYTDLILGKPLPLVLAANAIEVLSHAIMTVLFLRRGLALHPRMHQLVVSTALADRHGLGGLAHVERDLARFLLLVQGYIVDPKLSRQELGRRISTLVGWVENWVENDHLPQLPVDPPVPRVLDHGTNGFVLAETTGPLDAGWLELFRMGYLRGVLATIPKNDRRGVLMARKSAFVAFDLAQAAKLLNAAESQLGGTEGREPDGGKGGWAVHSFVLTGPIKGTALPLEGILQVAVRV